MSKEKGAQKSNDKKAPVKNLKEKRAEKKIKQAEKSKQD